MRKSIIATGVVLVLFMQACKKELSPVTPPTTNGSIASMQELLKDSLYLYTKEIYLWHDVLPTYDAFNPRQYNGATDLAAASAEMNAIRQLQPLDRFSFVTTKATSEGLQTGAHTDLGFFVKAASIDVADPIDSIRWFVTYVYDQSTAGKAGVSRGWYINKINNTAITYAQPSIDILNNVFFGTTASANFQFIKPDGSVEDVALTKTEFISNSVLYKGVIPAINKKVGYLVFNQFFGAPSRTELTSAFSYFSAQGVNELVVDLRYNPGGSTETQDALANMIAPASANNKVMYKYIFNSSLQQGNFPLLKKKANYSPGSFSEANNTLKFLNTGMLNLSRVFFIVTGSSASASELLINNLKPYMDVKLIGDTTYGKPVGFFPVDIYNYSIYPISFKTVNSAGNADYYNGFAPDKNAPDGVNKPWGDVSEPCLASALKYISTGSFRTTGKNYTTDQQYEQQLKTQQQLAPLTRQLEQQQFSGMFIEK